MECMLASNLLAYLTQLTYESILKILRWGLFYKCFLLLGGVSWCVYHCQSLSPLSNICKYGLEPTKVVFLGPALKECAPVLAGNIRLGRKWLTVANSPDYNARGLTTAVKMLWYRSETNVIKLFPNLKMGRIS